MTRLWMTIPLTAMMLMSTALAGEDAPSPLRFRGAPLSRCENFMITEWGLGSYVVGGPEDSETWHMAVEMGMMHNRSPRSAIGMTFFAGFDDEGNREGLKARYRRWLAGKSGKPGPMSVELSAGLFFGGSSSYDQVVGPAVDEYGHPLWRVRYIQYPSPMVSVGLNAGDWISFVSQLEWIRLDRGESELAWTAGLRLGSYAGLIGGVGIGCVAAFAISSMDLGFGG
jgi:hypothetical protein